MNANTPVIFLPAVLILALMLATGCAQNVDGTWKAPFIYRIDIQQGNVVDQEMIDKLKPGMDKNQVKFILGTPLVADPFHNNRWDYIYSYEPGRGERQQRRITVYFKDDKLTHLEGNIQATERSMAAEEAPKERSVDVPLERHKEGFFSTLFRRDDEATDAISTDTPEDSGESVTDETTVETTTEVQAPETGESEVSPDETFKTWQSETAKSGTEAEVPSDTTARGSTIESDQDKNLLRRFWDRMTSDESESGIQSGEETERDLRDAEVFKDAGGDL